MTFKEFVVDLFRDERGSISIKPLVAFIGSLFLCATMMLNAFSLSNVKPDPELINAVMIITAIGMGADSVDKWTKKPKEETKE